LERAILTLLSGGKAEKRFTGRHNHVGASEDFHQAVNLASYLCGNDKVLQAYMLWMEARAEAMVDNNLNWAAIESLAAALLAKRRIGYRAARKIITDAKDSLIFRRDREA
jgi:hypothetical protein